MGFFRISHRELKVSALHETMLFLILAFCGFLGVFFLNAGIAGPMIQADEGSYLANAAAIAGFKNDFATSYHAGYSILLAPAFALATEPDSVWTGVRLINAILFGWMVWLLYRLANTFQRSVPVFNKVFSVVLASAYPMWVVMAGYSFAQIAFVPFYVLLVLLLGKALRGGETLNWIFPGLVAGFLFWIHPTAMPAIIALVLVTALACLQAKKVAPFLIVLATVVSVIIAYRSVFLPLLQDSMTISGNPAHLHYPGVLRFLQSFKSLDDFLDLTARFGGHVFYLTISTVGLLWVGLAALYRDVKKVARDDIVSGSFNAQYTALFILLAFVGTLCLSVLFFQAPSRLDHWLYGRYVEPLIAPILLLGALSSKWRVGLISIPVAAMGAWLLDLRLEDYSHIAYFNVSGFWQFFRFPEAGIWIWLISGIALIIVAYVFPRKIGYFVVMSAFVTSGWLQISWHERASANAAQRWHAAHVVRDRFEAGTCVGFDHSGITTYNRHVFWFDFALQLFDYQLKRMTEDQWLETCEGPLFSYSSDLHERGINAHPIAISPLGGPILWRHGSGSYTSMFPLRVQDGDPALVLLLGSGWHALGRELVWSSNESVINVPLPSGSCSSGCEVMLKFDVFGASHDRPIEVVISQIDGTENVIKREVFYSQHNQLLTLPVRPGSEFAQFRVEVPNAISPNQLLGGKDERVLGVGLRSVNLSVPGIIVDEFGQRTMTQVGSIDDGVLSSTGQSGFLLFGPYRTLAAGNYRLIMRGDGDELDGVRIDVVSSRGEKSHGNFVPESNPSRSSILLDESIVIEEVLQDVEVRVRVDESDSIRLFSYKLLPELD